MKRFYFSIMMLSVIVAASSFSSCSKSDDGENGGNGGGEESLVVDKVAYYADASLTENTSRGLHLSISCMENPNSIPVKELDFYIIGIKKVTDLGEGDTFYGDDLAKINIENFGTIGLYEKQYEITSGSISIQSIDRYKVKVRFNDLMFSLESSTNIYGEDYDPQNPTTHKVSGTASFHNSFFEGGDWSPFY